MYDNGMFVVLGREGEKSEECQPYYYGSTAFQLNSWHKTSRFHPQLPFSQGSFSGLPRPVGSLGSTDLIADLNGLIWTLRVQPIRR